MKTPAGILAVIFFLAGCAYLGFGNNFLAKPAQYGNGLGSGACLAENNTVVTNVIDGDTVVVSGGHHVRLVGIDADEKDEACYDEAKSRLSQLLQNQAVRLEKDRSDIDKYNRCLRNIFLNGMNIAVILAREGLVVARSYGSDVKYEQEIIIAQKEAFDNGRGCKWGN